MRALIFLYVVAACGDNDASNKDAGGMDAPPELPFFELPMLVDYNQASETVIAATANDVVVLAIDQKFPSVDSFEYPATDDDPDHPFRRIAYATSHDRGDTFSIPLPLVISGRTDPVVRVGADGSFWAVATDPSNPTPTTDLLRSLDRGDTFSTVATVPIGDKSWIAVDDIRQGIWIAGAAFFGLIGFDGTTRAEIDAGDGISTAYADAAGGHFIGDGGFQAVVWDGVTAPQLDGGALPAGDIASTWTTSTVSMNNTADGGQWILRALHDSVGGSPIVVRVRHLPDEGVDVPISRPGTLNFLPVGVLDDGGRLHAVWYESSSGLTGQLVYSHSETADLQGAYTTPIVVDANACPGDGWYPYTSADPVEGGRRLREYIGITVTANRAIVSWTHAPAAPSRVRVAHVDF